MDPASLAIGILPLAINISQVSSAVRQKITNYKSAPADIQNILEKTDLIGKVCSRLEVDLRSPNPHYEVAIIEQALKKCHTSVSSVHRDLEKVMSQKKDRQVSMRYVFSKSHIDRSLSDLNDSISMLNTCISMSTCLSMNTIASARLHISAKDIKEPPSVQEAAKQEFQNVARPLSVRKQHKSSEKIQTLTRFCHRSLLLYENRTASVTDENGENKRTSHSYLIGSPLLGAFVGLAMRYGPLSPFSLTLDSPRFIYEENEKGLFDNIIRCCPGSGATPQDVSRWIAKFNIKPNTQLVDRGNYRHSVLAWLVAKNKYEAYKYLLDNGCQHLGNEQHIFYGHYWDARTSKKQYETATLYIDMRGPLLTIEEYETLLTIMSSPAEVDEMFNLFKKDMGDEMENFVSATMEALVNAFQMRHRQGNLESWASSVSILLDSGLDIHQDPFFPGCTALYWIMTCHHRTITAILECAEIWLQVLEHASVNIDKYLYIEYRILLENMELGFEIPEAWLAEDMQPWPEMSVRTRLEILFDMLHPGRRLPIFADPTSSDDLLQIMSDLREVDQSPLWVDISKEPSHIDWKRSRMYGGHKRKDSWPYRKSTRSGYCSQREFKNVSKEVTRALASHDRFLQLMDDRFQRRQQKKWDKLKKGASVAEETEKMPGGWKLEWWDYQGSW